MNENFEKMVRRTGGYSLPWLIHLYDESMTVELFLINDVQGIEHVGNTYEPSTFKYVPGNDETGFESGGSLDIAITDNAVIDLIETYRSIFLDVDGILLEDGTVTETKSFSHHYGTVTWNGKKASFNFDKDDRLNMTFPAMLFSNYNNRGNA